MSPIERLLETDDSEVESRWNALQLWFSSRFGRSDTGLESVLFLIGIQESGRGFQPKLQKEAKQELIMLGTYCAFESVGIYRRTGTGADGRPAFERAIPDVPGLPVESQEKLLRLAVLTYFQDLVSDDLPLPL